MTYGYEDALARRAAATGRIAPAGGSGYFAPRAAGLDPSLFEYGDHLRPDVRMLVLSTLYRFWSQHYSNPREWSTAWIAGSGITTAWNADRESGGAPGDLDVLIGVDYQSFFRDNPRFAGNPESAMVGHFNQQLHDGLWGHTARTVINGSTYELTYYVNPGGSDIRAINPYAAYNVSNDSWTVHPVDVPTGFNEKYFDQQHRAQVASDAARAQEALGAYHSALAMFNAAAPGSGHAVNAARALHEAVRTGAALFSEIHDGRRDAFGPGGNGYFDVANYRWQAGKGNGVVPATRVLKQIDEQAHQDIGMPCGNTDHLLLVAALANGVR